MSAFDLGLLDPMAGAAQIVGDTAFLDALIDVEQAHLEALGGIAPAAWRTIDTTAIAEQGAAGGNPVIPLVGALRRAAPDVADLVHLGLTSQDVIDTALMLLAARAVEAAAAPTVRVVEHLARLADVHRHAPVAGRTLGQQAAPTTAGLRFAVLLDGVVRTWNGLRDTERPVQLGGSVGTCAVLVDRLGIAAAEAARRDVAGRLGLDLLDGVWHVERSPIARCAAALAMYIGALGRLGLEIAQGTRTEIGELVLELGDGAGGSSAMPQKQNPVPAILLVANARRAPALASTLLAAQLALDERPAGDWHAEWQPFRELLRLALESAALADRAVAALEVDDAAAAANLRLSRGVVHAERAQQVLAAVVGRDAASDRVRAALRTEDFVAAVRASASDLEPATREELVRVTSTGGPIGLSDRFIDAALRTAERAR